MQLLPGICATALVATFALPANAAPVFISKAPTAQSAVIQVQDGPRWRRNYGWHNGHRGYRHYRRGYREHNGFWFPAGAFIAGAIIGSAIANSNNYYGGYDDYEDRYYGRRYYPGRYYGDRYHGDRYYGEHYASGRPCSPRMEDAGKCRSFYPGYYGNYRRRVVILDR